MTCSYKFPFFNPISKRMDHFRSNDWAIVPEIFEMAVAYPEIKLRVTMSSDPGLLDGPIVADFVLRSGKALERITPTTELEAPAATPAAREYTTPVVRG